MKVIFKYSDRIEERDYPRTDMEPIDGFNQVKVEGEFKDIDSDHPDYCTLYFIEEKLIDNPNPEQYYLIRNDNFTDKKLKGYSHFFICERVYKLVTKPNEVIIQRLSDELGKYLDDVYPIWERNKHLQEFLFDANTDRIEYIKKLSSWLTECRDIRKKRELKYIENGEFPEFGNYPDRP
jgi:hypothetical protein